jgi:hypothetical protein
MPRGRISLASPIHRVRLSIIDTRDGRPEVSRTRERRFTETVAYASGLDLALDQLINSCLQPNPSERPNSCDAIMAVLRTCAARPPAPPTADIELDAKRPGRGAERRTTVRFAVDLTATFVPFHQNMRGRWEATILDVSPGGICLRIPRPVAVQSVLQVDLVRGAAPELVLVRWVKPHRDDDHIAGCAFVRPLPGPLLEAMCRHGTEDHAV